MEEEFYSVLGNVWGLQGSTIVMNVNAVGTPGASCLLERSSLYNEESILAKAMTSCYALKGGDCILFGFLVQLQA